jgi:hypothetical protein
MSGGVRIAAACATLDQARARARGELSRLPARLRDLGPAEPPFRVEVSPALRRYQEEVARLAAD